MGQSICTPWNHDETTHSHHLNNIELSLDVWEYIFSLELNAWFPIYDKTYSKFIVQTDMITHVVNEILTFYHR